MRKNVAPRVRAATQSSKHVDPKQFVSTVTMLSRKMARRRDEKDKHRKEKKKPPER